MTKKEFKIISKLIDLHTRKVMRGDSEVTLREYKELDEKAIEALKADIEDLLVDKEDEKPIINHFKPSDIMVPLYSDDVKPITPNPNKLISPNISPWDPSYPNITCCTTSKNSNIVATANSDK